MAETKDEVLDNKNACTKPMFDTKPVFPVASGGLHPGLVPKLMEYFGNNVVIQAGGGIHGHPDGTINGAKALRQAVDATILGIQLKEFAKTRPELQKALEKWPIS
jgi:ribulose-bisphosphate carboxylase large chain